MMLREKKINGWPKLAWVAVLKNGAQQVNVFHGPMVEVSEDWCVEAVWAGCFEDGDFDQTDLIFGSGVRCRDNKVIFVSSGATTDRLWRLEKKSFHYVSNSLPALLAMSDVDLIDKHNYWADIRTVCGGLESYSRTLPTVSGAVGVLYFNNLIYDGKGFYEEKKVDAAPRFSCFNGYFDFLSKTAETLGLNASSPRRAHRIGLLTSISSGYDASTAAVISRFAGCRHSVTLRQSSSFWRGSDSGENVAHALGLGCKSYNSKAKKYQQEAAFWAASGRAFLVNWSQFEYLEPLCLFFSGSRGDLMWGHEKSDNLNPFSVPSVGDMGMAEFRLIRGVFHCPVPFWGIRHVSELRAISRSDEMRPWSVAGDYNRPIARRIVEEAGISRGSFATIKKNTSLASYFNWPYSPNAAASFQKYLKRRGFFAPSLWLARIFKLISTVDILLYLNFTGKFGLVKGDVGLRRLLKIEANDMLFQWANWELKQLYNDAVGEFPGRANNISESTCFSEGRFKGGEVEA